MTPKPVEIRGKNNSADSDVSSVTSSSAAKKPLFIALFVVGALVLLSLLLFVGQKQFAGRAIYTGQDFSAGVTEELTVAPQTPFSLTVKANIKDKKSVAVGFRMTFPDGVACSSIDSVLGWKDEGVVLSKKECVGDTALFSYGTIWWEDGKTGEFPIATIYFNGINKESDYELVFDSFEVIDLETGKNLISLKDVQLPTITVGFSADQNLQACMDSCDAEKTTCLEDYSETECNANLKNCQEVTCGLDSDKDGIKNYQDNCPYTANPDQKDSNGNGVGDACEGKAIDVCSVATPHACTDEEECTNVFGFKWVNGVCESSCPEGTVISPTDSTQCVKESGLCSPACGAGESCVNGLCQKSCIAKNCVDLGKACGSYDDGCGAQISCGGCSSIEGCNANGQCQPLPDSCNTMEDCFTGSGKGCTNGQCVDLPPETNCADGVDNDNDGKIDCLDPNNCLGGDQCASSCTVGCPAGKTCSSTGQCVDGLSNEAVLFGPCSTLAEQKILADYTLVCQNKGDGLKWYYGVGDSCKTEAECVANTACVAKGTNLQTSCFLKAGESCVASGSCASGNCENGKCSSLPIDTDSDGVPDSKDNCPQKPNADQKDSNGNGFGDVCDPTTPKSIVISVKSGNVAVAADTKVTVSNDYDIIATITPQKDLTSHLVLTKVTYDDNQVTYFADKKPVLKAGSTETVKFSHTVLPEMQGKKFKVEVLIWSDWLSDISDTKTTWTNFEIKPESGSYDIQ